MIKHGQALQKLPTSGQIDTDKLLLEWTEVPWDTPIFGSPVLQITRIEVRAPEATQDFTSFVATRDSLNAAFVSCRLPHDRLRESMLLEAHGFRFIEMVYQPELDHLSLSDFTADAFLEVNAGRTEDLPALEDIAGSAFRTERFHMDPRIDPALGDQRYRTWVKNSIDHPSQRLYAIRDQSRLVAFFVTESQTDGTCYWHLTAVAPDVQGQGYGRKAWVKMLKQAKDQGAKRVQTCIAARNHRVLNLYARLGFYFPLPLMTFHWIRPCL